MIIMNIWMTPNGLQFYTYQNEENLEISHIDDFKNIFESLINRLKHMPDFLIREIMEETKNYENI